jgi:hypothetical protein
MQLANQVYSYYLQNKSELSDDKLFHFATRMAAWRGVKQAYDILRDCEETITIPGQPLDATIAEIYNRPQTGRRNAHELRQPFFEKYPKLYGAHLALFRVRHLQEVYGIDAREALFASISKDELITLKEQLLSDEPALKTLSTFAINFCYLLDRVILNDADSLPIDMFLRIGGSYDTTDPEQLQLLIYFYTHCIIGESNFYVREIPEKYVSSYTKMLQEIEVIITEHFDEINLDNKLEFLVCARICHYETALSEKIYEECEQSISEEGTFLIDVHNKNAQSDRNDFVKSEHRNVLFIMSTSAYTPHSTLLL